jgi:hypothetical protein
LLRGIKPSISSKKMMDGLFSRARAKTSGFLTEPPTCPRKDVGGTEG